MVKTKLLRQNNDDDQGSEASTTKQSLTSEDMLLSAAKLNMDSNAPCLTCVRNTNQKYCYDSSSGLSTCCEMADVESPGCNQQENARLICSTDKLVTRSAAYEVCPHNPEQCDTKMLQVNNQMHGVTLSEDSQASTIQLLNMQEDEEGLFGIFPIFEGYTTKKTNSNPTLQGSIQDAMTVSEVITLAQKDGEASKEIKVDNNVAQVSLIDDSYWRSIEVNSVNGTVCSYQLLNSDIEKTNNVFEVQLSGLKNVQIGLYYGQYKNHDSFDLTYIDGATTTNSDIQKQLESYSRLIDMRIFDSDDCVDLLHCTVSTNDHNDEDRYIQLMLSKAEFVNLNLLPVFEDSPMHAKISYRLINQQEHTFIIQTLAFMGVGFCLIFLFIGLLFRALNPKSRA